jgi:nuclear pore complex protein Nup133
MFSQDELYKEYMDEYFSVNPTPGVSWIHSLGSGRYGETASALLVESEKPTLLAAQTVRSSFLPLFLTSN